MDVGLRHFAEKNPHATAIVDPQGRHWSRGEFCGLVDQLTHAFADSSLRPGDAVAILSPNCAEYLAVYFAGLQTGLFVVPINFHLAEAEIEFVLADADCRAVISNAALGPNLLTAIERMRPNGAHLISIGEAPGYTSLAELVRNRPATRPDTITPGRMMAYTSATTGRPKAVKLPPQNAQAALERIVRANAVLGTFPEDDNTHLGTSMLYHSAPLRGAQVALEMGHRVVLVDLWRPEQLLQLIDEFRVTTTFMVPAMMVRLVRLPQSVRERYSVRSLRFVAHGGAPCPADVKRAIIEWFGPVVWETYGSTEASGTLVNSEEWLKYPGTVGRPFLGSGIKICDEHGQELPPNRPGLIYILPHTGDRFEYKGDPEKTQRAYRGDYVTVGDIGYLNEQGFLFLLDRSANLIISSGMNIYPAEIETVLAQHPAVADCAVLGVPHELLGEVPKAFVQLEPDYRPGPEMTLALLQYLGSRISPAKVPKRIEYLAGIPRDPNGKLYKRLLRERIAQ
jgi:long-chain acyl-CoA synthetase